MTWALMSWKNPPWKRKCSGTAWPRSAILPEESLAALPGRARVFRASDEGYAGLAVGQQVVGDGGAAVGVAAGHLVAFQALHDAVDQDDLAVLFDGRLQFHASLPWRW